MVLSSLRSKANIGAKKSRSQALPAKQVPVEIRADTRFGSIEVSYAFRLVLIRIEGLLFPVLESFMTYVEIENSRA